MKFHCFNLMPWPYLPDDFRERYPSVWIDAPAAELYDGRRGRQVYNDYLELLRAADDAGFDSVGVNEHHFNAYGLMPSPNLMGAILARETSRAKILVLGNSAALYNPPIRVAEEMAVIDVLSNGRLIAGFPVGTAMDSVFSYSQNPTTLRDKYHEAVDLILKAWEADRPFAWNGRYHKLRYVSVWPRPIQARPPVWIPGASSVEVWEWCIESGFLYAYLSFFGLEHSRATLEGYWETVERLRAEPNPYRTAIVQFVAIADSDAEAERLYKPHGEYFYNRCLYVDPTYAQPPGYVSARTLRRNLERGVRGGPRPSIGSSSEVSWKDIVERGWIVAGSPATVKERLLETIKAANVGHVIVQPHFGSLPKELALNNLRRFASEVMPELRPLYGEWEDRWWPADAESASMASKESLSLEAGR
jgi:alkanesulfonate monooxygenase SsuD/methylene tetrahydromethanopterin reductase-like flavin-dependent oxidoreductase (luciferase family)